MSDINILLRNAIFTKPLTARSVQFYGEEEMKMQQTLRQMCAELKIPRRAVQGYESVEKIRIPKDSVVAKWRVNLASTGTELGGKVAGATRSIAGTININKLALKCYGIRAHKIIVGKNSLSIELTSFFRCSGSSAIN